MVQLTCRHLFVWSLALLSRSDYSSMEVHQCENSKKMQEMSEALDRMLMYYDKRIRPDYGGDPVEVTVNFNVRSMGPISEMDMIFTMDCYFRQIWTDKRLAMNISGLDTVALNIQILDRIWFPDTVFYNGMKSFLHMITTPNRFIRIHPGGKVLFSQRLTVRALCKMNLQNYPLDTQICPLNVGSFAYSKKDVVYLWRQMDPVEMAFDMMLSQFDLMGYPVSNSTDLIKGAMHTILYVHFRLRRHMGYFLINVYVPCCLLVVLSWVSFWINREATSDRIALGTMTVLTMTFLGLESRNDLPRVSYTTALDVYIAMCFTFVLATMVQFAAVHSYTKHGYGEQMPDSPTTPDGEGDQEEQHQLLPPPKNRPLLMKRNVHGRRRFSRISIKRAASRVWRRLTMRRKRKKLEDERNSVSRIDKASRILFPLAFLIFNLLYSALYISLFI